MASIPESLERIVRADSGVSPSYVHIEKQVTSLEPIETNAAILNWYDLAAQEKPVPDEIRTLARDFLNSRTIEASGMGFVILHRCGEAFYFLICSTWRGSNELWETVFYKNGEKMPNFELFPRDGEHKATFCVWEMAVLFHEKTIWERFLITDRSLSAANAWLMDRYNGPA